MEPHIPEQLKEIAAKVEQGQEPASSVRVFLSWFWGAQRRGSFIKQVMRGALAATNLQTVPDFDETYIDGPIRFVTAVRETSHPDEHGGAGEIKVALQDSMVLEDSLSSKVK
jgi:hypothetical protein